MSISVENDQKNVDSLESIDDRDLILLKLNEAIDKVHNKAMNGRVSDNDKSRVQWFKTLAYMISIYNQVKKDSDIEDLEKQVQKLAKQINELI
jgi:hypothetical protein